MNSNNVVVFFSFLTGALRVVSVYFLVLFQWNCQLLSVALTVFDVKVHHN